MAASTQDIEPISDAMDYAQHEGTWKGFTRLVKWMIVALAIVVVALFFIINP